jgi:hypothetical protein
MSSPVLAIASSVWSRHRIGFIVAAVILAVLAVIFPFLVAITPAGAMALVSLAPLVGISAFVLNSLLFVEDAGSLTSRYPRYMLTLPVRTGTLVLWPMLFVSVGAGLLWVVAALLVYRPAGYHAPLFLPALSLAGLMAWAQALAWMPIRVFWVREFTTIILAMLLGCLGALPVWIMFTGAGSAVLVALVLLTYIAAAFVVGWAAVASDRQGIDWRIWPTQSNLARLIGPGRLARAKRPFRSAFDAQLSYEWGCHGLILNGFVGVIQFVIWGVLLLRQGRGTPTWLALIFAILPIVLVTMIAATGPAFGRFRPFWSHQRGLAQTSTFIATRPMTSARLVAAKFRMAAASVIANWILAVAGTTCWLAVSDNHDNAQVLAREFFSRYPGGKGFAVIALTCILVPALSWRFLTGSLVPVLTGRRWVADGAVWLYLSFLAALGGCGVWLAKSEPDQLARLYSVIPLLVLAIVLVKGATAVAGFHLALQRRLLSWRNIASLLGLWFVLTVCGIALAVLLGSTSAVPISLPILALGVAALVPLARFPLATLALDWNRHR